MITYNMTFMEALQCLIDNKGWVQGEHFADGMVMMFDNKMYGHWGTEDHVHCYDLNSGEKFTPQITRGLLNQKFRIVHTQPDANRKVRK